MRPQGGRGRGAGAGGGTGTRSVTAVDQFAPLGEYTVTLDLGGKTLTQKARVTKTQGWSLGPSPQIIR